MDAHFYPRDGVASSTPPYGDNLMQVAGEY